MNKSWFYLGVIGSLAILTTSCGGDSGKPATPAASPSAVASPAASPVAVVPPTVPATPIATTAPAPTVAATPPTVPGKSTGKKPVSVDVAAGLIAPTDGDNWAKTVSKGRTDPFAMLTLQPIEVAEVIDPLNPTVKPQSAPSSIASNNSAPIKPSIKLGTKVASNSSPISTIDAPKSKMNPKDVDISQIPISGVNRKFPKMTVAIKPSDRKLTVAIKPLPPVKNATLDRKSTVALKPLPQPLTPMPNGAATVVPTASKPTLSQTVGISGVIQVGGTTQIIVKLPNESFSRYVEVGDRIYDGKITVKRVEGEQTLSPVVVLEEVGVEVTRRIGDVPVSATKEAQVK
jgi:hypothetical protein